MSKADVLIVGGGVIGLSIARELGKRRAGRVVLLDKGVCGGEASWAAAGMLAPQAEVLETGPFFSLCSSSRDMYPRFAGELLDETGVDIELDRQGTFYLAFNEHDQDELRHRYRVQREAGLDIELLTQEEILRVEPDASRSVQMGLFFPGDWQVDNRKLCEALTLSARSHGVEIHENTTVKRIVIEDERVTGVEADGSHIAAGTVVLAAGAWSSLIDADVPFTVEPVRGQMLEFRTAERRFSHVIYTPRGYIVPRADGRVLAGSTTEHVGYSKTVTELADIQLRKVACEISPLLTDGYVSSWAGLRPFISDGQPVLGPVPDVEGLLAATGHYRNGILLAPLTGTIIADSIVDGAEPDAFRLFGAGRFLPFTAAVA